jgi:hypothetical protein
MGKLKGNFLGTEFVLLDGSAEKQGKKVEAKGKQLPHAIRMLCIHTKAPLSMSVPQREGTIISVHACHYICRSLRAGWCDL